MVEINNVAGLFAAQHIVGGAHFFEHVTVADCGLNRLNTFVTHRENQTKVRHHGHDKGVSLELATLTRIHRERAHDLVTVDQIAFSIDCQATVCVTIVSDTEVCLVLDDGLLQAFRVG